MNTSKTIVAIDVGYGNTKAVWGRSLPNERTQGGEICFKSVAPLTSKDPNILADTAVQAMDRVQVQANGQWYLVGPDAFLAGGGHPLDSDYVRRNEYLALLRGALHYMFKSTGIVTSKIDALALGLPISNYGAHKEALKALGKQDHIIAVPVGLRPVFGDAVTVAVDNVVVLPQPLGALRAHSELRGRDSRAHRPDALNLIVDPGYNTFDWLLCKGLQPDLTRSGSFQGGVSQILRAVSSAAGLQLACGHIDLVECEQALETGELHANGRKYAFGPYQPVAENAAEEIVDRFVNAIDMRRRFDNIIMTGGGAKFYASALRRRLPAYTIVVDEQSLMMNARGFYLIAQDLLGQSAAPSRPDLAKQTLRGK